MTGPCVFVTEILVSHIFHFSLIHEPLDVPVAVAVAISKLLDIVSVSKLEQ